MHQLNHLDESLVPALQRDFLHMSGCVGVCIKLLKVLRATDVLGFLDSYLILILDLGTAKVKKPK